MPSSPRITGKKEEKKKLIQFIQYFDAETGKHFSGTPEEFEAWKKAKYPKSDV